MKTIISKRIAYALALAGAITVSGCGGSGAGKEGPALAPVAKISLSHVIPMDNFDLEVIPVWDYTSNIAENYMIKISDPSKIVALRASAGLDYETAAPLVATPTGNPGEWKIVIPRTFTIENGLLLTFDLPNGDTVETGLTSFSFAEVLPQL